MGDFRSSVLIACFLAASTGESAGNNADNSSLDAGTSDAGNNVQSASPKPSDAGSSAKSESSLDAGAPVAVGAGSPATSDAGSSNDAGASADGGASNPASSDAGTAELATDAGTPPATDAGTPATTDGGSSLLGPKPRVSRIPKDPGIAPEPPQLSDEQLFALARSGRRYWSVAFHAYYRPFFSPPPEQGGLFTSTPLLGLTATLHNVFRRNFNLDIEGSYAWGSGTVNSLYVTGLPYSMNSFELSSALSYDFSISERIIPYVGVRIGVNFNNRSFTSTTYIAPSQTFTGAVPGLFVGARYRVTPRISIGVRARVGYLPFDGNKGSWLGDFGGFIEYAAGLK